MMRWNDRLRTPQSMFSPVLQGLKVWYCHQIQQIPDQLRKEWAENTAIFDPDRDFPDGFNLQYTETAKKKPGEI